MRTKSHAGKPTQHRSGMILVLVLVIVMLMSFAVYQFSALMLLEYEATSTGVGQYQRRSLATSAIHAAVSELRSSEPSTPQHRDGSGETGQILNGTVHILSSGVDYGAVTVLRHLNRPAGRDTQHQLPYGLLDESAKLNLNSLSLKVSAQDESRRRLMELPGITIQIADAVLDWMDPDDEAREFGAESDWYSSRSRAGKPRHGPLRSLDEMLLIRGMNSHLLYGEDQNENGLLDVWEDDGASSPPNDNRDGVLQSGLSEYLTVLSCESNRTSDGLRKININDSHLDDLYDRLVDLLDAESATYIVAWRVFGATYPDQPRPDEGDNLEKRRLERLESARLRLQSQLGQFQENSTKGSSVGMPEPRAGIRLPDKPPFQFKTLVELFGGQIRATIQGKDQLLQSPWPSDPASLGRLLPRLESILCLNDDEFTVGRININQASMLVLRTIPGTTDSLAQSILKVRSNNPNTNNERSEFSTIAWLVTRGLVNTGMLRRIAPYICTSGSVHSGVAVGQTPRDIPVSAVFFRVVIHGAESHILEFRDLPVMPCQSLGLPVLD